MTPPYLVLVDAPNPDDGVPPCREQSVECWVQLQGVDSISVVLLHFISNNIGDLTNTATYAFCEITNMQ